ncbi:P22 phage major capsid protein family protein [Aurantimonas coralicida]|uniref:P22 phage major capsid protein family protein n=1 Tax=Aurantimonas coralicida TaxID=182270 RepID=UPI001E38164C|nr:P22 phage major capsid protein family protein [Aurantimonas coralicida]MCD1644155.1 hypothetical protein [Aurantimonas coralicida]
MANQLLTPTAVTREALRILHQKLNFIGNVNRTYDDSFAKDGAKIGDSLKIRLPNQYSVRTGATLSTQDTTETSVTLQVATQKGVDLNFTSTDLTMSLDSFSDRILKPAMSVLAANIESDMLQNVYKDVYQQANNVGSAITFKKVLDARKLLVDSLTPPDMNMLLNTQDNIDLVDALKGLFNDQSEVAKQYRTGMVGRTAGFDFWENTMMPSHTVGAHGGTPLVNGASQTGASLATDGWTNSTTGVLKEGDVFTIAGVFRVHPETKVSTGALQQFVVTADADSGATTGPATLSISPSIVVTGARQNVTASPADNAAITVVGTASTAHDISLAFHKDAFAFATADLVMPKGVDFSSRQVLDGVSMRIVRAYDINNDKFPCRLDVLYGYKTLRAEMAARVANN